METQIVTAVLNGRMYHFNITIEKKDGTKVYKVGSGADAAQLKDLIPDQLEFSEEGTSVKYDPRLETDEGRKIAAEIWKAIKNALL